MPKLIHRDGGSAVFDTPQEVEQALASGDWSLPAGQSTVGYASPVSGDVTQLAPEALEKLPGYRGYGVERPDRGFGGALEAAEKTAYSGLGDQLIGMAEGAAGTLSLGATDVALDYLGADTALRAKHTAGRQVGEIAATAATMFSPFGKGGLAKALSATPAGAASKFGAGGASGLARVARTAGEGAAYGLGQAVSGVALAEPGLTAEQVLSELGQGALLGAALGGGVGALGEGARLVSAAKAARRAAAGTLDLSSGVGKEAVADLTAAHADVETMLGLAQRDAGKAALEVAEQSMAGAAAMTAQAARGVDDMVRSVGRLDPELTKPIMSARDVLQYAVEGKLVQAVTKADVEAMAAAFNPAAKSLKRAGISRKTVRDVTEQAAAGNSVPLEQMLDRVDGLLAKDSLADATLDGLYRKMSAKPTEANARAYLSYVRDLGGAAKTRHPQLREAAELALKNADDEAARIAKALKDSTPAAVDARLGRELFDMKPDEKFSSVAFERLLKREPKEIFERALKLDEYYAQAKAAVGHDAVAAARVDAAIKQYKVALDKLVSPQMQAAMADPKVLAQLLGVEAVAEVALPEGPAKTMLQLAAAYKLVGGVAGVRGRVGGVGRQIVSAITKRAAAGAASGWARELPFVKRMGTTGQTAVVGGAAGAGYQFVGWFERVTRGAKSLTQTEGHVRGHLDNAVERAVAGKPQRVRAMPALNLLLDRLMGEPEPGAKASTNAEKYKLVQQKLAQYAAAPDAVLAGVYDTLLPLADVNEQLADAAEAKLGVQLAYLAQHMPRDPGTMVVLGKSRWQATDREMYEFGMRALGVIEPLRVVDMIVDGFAPPQAAEALAATNPDIFNKLLEGVLARADEFRENSTQAQRISLGLAMGVTLDPVSDPRYVAFMQDMHAKKTMEQAAGSAGSESTPEESYSDAQKLLG